MANKRVHGRGGGIRTPDPLLPKQMRYQTALRPDSIGGSFFIVQYSTPYHAVSDTMSQPLCEPYQQNKRDHKNRRHTHSKQQ